MLRKEGYKDIKQHIKCDLCVTEKQTAIVQWIQRLKQVPFKIGKQYWSG